MGESLRVLIVNGVANFDHVRTFTFEVAYELSRLGCQTTLLDAARPVAPELVENTLASSRPDFLFSFNAFGFHLSLPGGRPLASRTLPWLTFLVDDPTFHLPWGPFLRQPGVVSIVGDPQSLISARRIGIPERACHLVYAGGHLAPWVEDSERCHDILFIGSVEDPRAIRQSWDRAFPPGVVRLMELLSEAWSKDVSVPAQTHLDELLRGFGLTFSEAERWHVEALVLGNVIRYVKNAERVATLRALSDLPISVFGSGFRELFPDANFRFFPGVSFPRSQEELCRAKIGLNVQSLAVHAAGERALGALLNGALLVSSESRYLASELEPGRDYFPFDTQPASLEAARATIRHYLAHPDERRALVRRVRDEVAPRMTWAARTSEVLDIARAVLDEARKSRAAGGEHVQGSLQ
ncbi:MAG: glycosyltransferase [Polyangiaceae bacterium]